MVDCTYDAFDRRVKKEIDGNGDGDLVDSVDQVVQMVYDGTDIVLSFDGSGSLTNRYLHGPAVDQILADEQYGTSGYTDPTSHEGVVYYPLTDNLNTVRDIVNDSGTVVNHIVYEAFGAIIVEKNGSSVTHQRGDSGYVEHIYAFTGRERDYESHLYGYRARYYDPLIGRFISLDMKGYAAGDENLYRYVGNSPTNATDPTGHQQVPGSDPSPYPPFDPAIITPPGTSPFDHLPFKPKSSIEQDLDEERAMDREAEQLSKDHDPDIDYDMEQYKKGKTPEHPIAVRRRQKQNRDKLREDARQFEKNNPIASDGSTSARREFHEIVRIWFGGERDYECEDETTTKYRDAKETRFSIYKWTLTIVGAWRGATTPRGPASGGQKGSNKPTSAKPSEPAKKVPNPHGKLGGPDHRKKVDEVVKDIESRGLIAETEVPVKTVDGKKGTRYMDVVARDPVTGEITEVHQVGKSLKSDPKVPVSRERDALRDVRHSPEIRGATRHFHPY